MNIDREEIEYTKNLRARVREQQESLDRRLESLVNLRRELTDVTGERDRQYDANVKLISRVAVLEQERDKIREALDRLLTGCSYKDDGDHNVWIDARRGGERVLNEIRVNEQA